jgi:hypothetical protein
VRRIKEQEERCEVKVHREREGKIFMKSKFLRELKTRTNLSKKQHSVTNNSNSKHNNMSSI